MSEILKNVGSGLSGSRKAQEAFRAGLKLLDAAAGNIALAGVYFAEISAPEWQNLIAEAPPTMRRTLQYIREVGEGKMIPELATESGEYAGRLRSLSIELQQKLYFQPVEMFRPGATGRHAKYLRHVAEMSSEEIQQAFERDGRGWSLRSYDEQKSFVAQAAAAKEAEQVHGVDRPGRWAVRGNKVYLAPAFVSHGLTRRQIENILKDMEEES